MNNKLNHLSSIRWIGVFALGYALVDGNSHAQTAVPILKPRPATVLPSIPPPPAFKPAPIVNVPRPVVRPSGGQNTVVTSGPPGHSGKPTLSESEPVIKQLRPETAALMAAASSGPATSNSNTSQDIARAQVVLNHGLAGQKASMPEMPGLAAKLADAMTLGGRQQSLMPQLAALNDSFSDGIEAQRRAALALFAAANQAPPSASTLDSLIAKAQAIHTDASAAPQHGRMGVGAQRIEVDSSPAVGLDRVSVYLPSGPDNQPERVTFDGSVHSQPDTFGSDLQPVVNPAPARVVTTKESNDLRSQVNGKWIDDTGEVWDITGSGDSIVFDQHYPDGHIVRYLGTWSLGLPIASHLVNDPDDMADDLPVSIKQQLADSYHPPFAIRLEYFPERHTLEGIWISGQVTYSQWFGIKVVDDPTWDKRLRLTRGGLKIAQGGRYPEDGP